MAPNDHLRFFARHRGVPFLLAAALLILGELSDFDLAFQALFFEPSTGKFPHTASWVFDRGLHDVGRAGVIPFLSSFRNA